MNPTEQALIEILDFWYADIPTEAPTDLLDPLARSDYWLESQMS